VPQGRISSNRSLRWLLATESYWWLIALHIAAGALVFATHLRTGQTPDRVAFTLPALNIPIFWYSLVILDGVILGAFVAFRVVSRRSKAAFEQAIPASVRELPLSQAALGRETAARLYRAGYRTVGEVLFKLGLTFNSLKLPESDRAAVMEVAYQDLPQDKADLIDSPWRRWDPEHVWSAIFWLLLAGIVGARLYHVLTPSPSMAALGIESPLDYFRRPLKLLDIRGGGLGIFGAIAGGAVALYFYARKYHLDGLAWTDLAAMGMVLGHSIGRWGNYFNQELYGRPSDLPWAITIEPAHRLSEYREFATYHPAFLYESLWNLAAFAILYFLATRLFRRLPSGIVTFAYIGLFAVGRILLETVRLDSRPFMIGSVDSGLPVASAVSLGMLAVAIGGMAVLLLRAGKQ